MLHDSIFKTYFVVEDFITDKIAELIESRTTLGGYVFTEEDVERINYALTCSFIRSLTTPNDKIDEKTRQQYIEELIEKHARTINFYDLLKIYLLKKAV